MIIQKSDKPQKKITLTERLNRDMIYQLPLLVTIYTIIIIPILFAERFDIILAQDYITKNSLLISFLVLLYTFLVYDMQLQVFNTYSNLLKQAKEENKSIIRFMHPWYLPSPLFAEITNFMICIRFFYLFTVFDVGVAEVVCYISSLILLRYGRLNYKKAEKLIKDNKNKFVP